MGHLDGEGALLVQCPAWSSTAFKVDQVALGLLQSSLKTSQDGVQQRQPALKPSHCEISFLFFFWLSLLSFCCASWRSMYFVHGRTPLWMYGYPEWIFAVLTHHACFLWLAEWAWHLPHSFNAGCCRPIVVLLAFLQLHGTWASLPIPSFLCWGFQKWLWCSWCSFPYA